MPDIDALVLDSSIARANLHQPQQFIRLGRDQYDCEEDDEKHNDPAELRQRDLITVTDGCKGYNHEVGRVMELQEVVIFKGAFLIFYNPVHPRGDVGQEHHRHENDVDLAVHVCLS